MKISADAGMRPSIRGAGDQRRRGPAAGGLDGVRLEDWRAHGDLALRGQVAYCVAPNAEIADASAQRRSDPRSSERARTRLRSAKIVNSAGKFLCECRIHDRSPGGLRLALARNIALPLKFCLYEDETGQTNWVVVVWRRGADAGVRFCAPGAPPMLKPSDRHALRERYYGVPDR